MQLFAPIKAGVSDDTQNNVGIAKSRESTKLIRGFKTVALRWVCPYRRPYNHHPPATVCPYRGPYNNHPPAQFCPMCCCGAVCSTHGIPQVFVFQSTPAAEKVPVCFYRAERGNLCCCPRVARARYSVADGCFALSATHLFACLKRGFPSTRKPPWKEGVTRTRVGGGGRPCRKSQTA